MFRSAQAMDEVKAIQADVMRWIDYEKRPYRIGAYEASKRLSLRLNRKKRDQNKDKDKDHQVQATIGSGLPTTANTTAILSLSTPQPQKPIAQGGFSLVYLGYPVKKRKLSMFWHSLQRAIKVINLGAEVSQDEYTRDAEGNDFLAKKRIFRRNREFKLELLQEIVYDSEGKEIPGAGFGDRVEPNRAGKWMSRLEVVEELRLLRKVQNSKYVVRLYDSFETSYQGMNQVWCVMEWLPSSLERLMAVGEDMPMPKEIRRSILEAVLRALVHLKTHRVVHCDIKPGNILLSSTGYVKLCDFGLSTEIPENEEFYQASEVGCTPLYAPPELSVRREYVKHEFNHHADIWSVGCLIYQLFVATTGLYEHHEQKHFAEHFWEAYEVSDEVYLYMMNGVSSFGLMNSKQRKEVCEHAGLIHTEQQEWDRLYQELSKDNLHDIIRKTLTPYRARNTVDIGREGVFQRPSAEDLLSSGAFTTKAGELKKRHDLIEMVKRAEAFIARIEVEREAYLKRPGNLSGVTEEPLRPRCMASVEARRCPYEVDGIAASIQSIWTSCGGLTLLKMDPFRARCLLS